MRGPHVIGKDIEPVARASLRVHVILRHAAVVDCMRVQALIRVGSGGRALCRLQRCTAFAAL
jgi:hypothetical protein